MKFFHAILVLAVLAFLGGCAVTEQSTGDVGQQFQNGLTGRGQIVSDKPMNDSFGSDFN
ncbi:MAG: hypothetical protein ABI615_13290 [Chthoniobacterales bacterium]